MQRATNISNRFLSFFIPVLLTVIFNLVFFPILNSGDDAFVMYTLSGGYGEDAKNLVQYHYGWHYLLGGLVVFLFKNFPGVNWYTVILLLIHLSGMIFILHVLLIRQPRWFAILLFLAGFLFIESRFLLSPNFSNTAFTGASGALTYLFHLWEKKEWKWPGVISAVILLLVAVMLRFHMVLFAVILFAPVILIRMPWRSSLRAMGLLISIVLFSFLLYWLHQKFYLEKVTGWKKQEEFRQNLFYAFNRPVDTYSPVFKNSAEKEKFFSFYMYDTAEFSNSRVKEISRGITRNARMDKKDLAGLYWTFLDLRIYILLFASILVYSWVSGQRQALIRWLPAVAIYLVVQVALFLFLKGTINLYLGLLMYLWVQLCLSFQRFPELNTKKFKDQAILASCIILSIWMGWRLHKENLSNKIKNERLLCTLTEFRTHPGNLFIVFGDIFYLSHFYVWDLPARHPLPNVLYKDRMITFTYTGVMRKFRITDMDSALARDDRVLIIGDPKFINTAKVDGFKCLQVRSVK